MDGRKCLRKRRAAIPRFSICQNQQSTSHHSTRQLWRSVRVIAGRKTVSLSNNRAARTKKHRRYFSHQPFGSATKGTKHIDRAHINQKTHIWRKKKCHVRAEKSVKKNARTETKKSKRWTHALILVCTCARRWKRRVSGVTHRAPKPDGVPIIRQGQRIQNSIHCRVDGVGSLPCRRMMSQAQVKFERSSILYKRGSLSLWSVLFACFTQQKPCSFACN